MPARHSPDAANRLFRAGITAAQHLKFQTPCAIIEKDWARAVSFPQRNGTARAIVTDIKTGSWLLTIGTWFHADGYGTGAESKLLEDCLKKGEVQVAKELEGFFVIVFGNGITKETVVVTDLVGSCHCFVRSCSNAVAISSSSLLLTCIGDECTFDPIGCQEFLNTGIMYEDRTLYKEVRKLGPGSVFRYTQDMQQTSQSYWRISDLHPESLDGRVAVRALGEALSCAAQKISRLFSRPVCDLTGGYDSRAIASAFLTGQVPFSVTVSGSPESADVIVSRGLAELLHLPHLHVNPTASVSFERVKDALSFTDGEYDLVEYARILDIHVKLSNSFNISINGSFGELARGYWWELLFPNAGERHELDAEMLARRRFAACQFDATLFPANIRLNLVAHLSDVIKRTNTGLSNLPNTLQMDHAYLAMRMQRWQGRLASSTNRLWPCLSPFLFRSVLETMLQTATRLRRRSGLIRYMLADFQPRLAEFPLEHGYPAAPVRWKNVARFWPLPLYYGKKVVSRLFSKIGKKRSAVPESLPPRLQLWAEDEVRELLRPAGLKVGELLDHIALNNFLERSHRQNFPFEDQWARVLSLEYTLRARDGLRSNGNL